ncbi:MAG: hypothetical protein HUU35_19300, partial [Armatimonadetes bacterium]|nr:hypothetical protein [Armatimonadota bacterium]
MPWFALLLLLAAPAAADAEDLTGWTIPQLWAKADEYFHDGRYADAIRLQARIRELDPTDVEAYTVAAWLTWSLGDEPGARRLLQQAVERNPGNWEPYWELGYHLLDRVGDAVAAVPLLEEACQRPPFPDRIRRTLAHAYIYAEQPARAVELWARLRAEKLAPLGVLEVNEPQALRLALRSDLLARNGGAVTGLGTALPRVLADSRRDTDGDGFAETRQLDLDDPTRADGRADFRITYRGQRIIYKPVWSWLSMETDLDGDGHFEVVLHDEDGDGIAESLPTPAELRRGRDLPANRRRFAAPDRYEVLALDL